MLGESTAKDRSHWAAGVDGNRVSMVDGRGRSVSTAILYEVERGMRTGAAGEVIKVRADVLPAVDSDIRAWCRSTGHGLVGVEEGAEARVYAVRKAAEMREQPGVGDRDLEPGS